MKISLLQYYAILSRYLRPQKLRFAALAALVLGSIGLQIANPQVMRYFLDQATHGGASQHLLIAAIAFVLIALVQQGVAIGAAYTGEYVAWVATNALREDLAAHCLRLDMRFHHEKSPGELIERIEGDSAEFGVFFSQLVLRVFGNILLIIGIIVALYLVDWRLGLLFTIFSIAMMLGLNAVRNVAVPHQKAFRDAETGLFGFLEERLAGTEDIRSSGAVGFTLRKLFELQTVILRCWRKTAYTRVIVRFTAGILLMCGFGAAMLIGSYLFAQGAITIGIAYMVMHYTGMISQPIREITMQVDSLQNIGATVERTSELLKQESAIVDGPGIDLPVGKPLPLAFDHVTFAYYEDKQVLRDVSFDLQPGKVMGLLGRTGSGKTTIARLIFRLYDPQEGAILLRGQDIRGSKAHELRQRVAFVTQDVQLFQASVRDNITFFDKTIPDERIMEVIEKLELGEWFAGLPQGLDTRLMTGGRSLSAGEGQLLAFTRVFLRNPGLVILDEASSRLDPATEQLIERAIDHLLENRSAIIIAHRLGTLQRADDVLLLEDGQVAEYGVRKALLADTSSRFYGLHQTGMEEVMI